MSREITRQGLPHRLCTPRAALTLLELLVVLVILSVVATVAVNSLQPRVEMKRFEQTRQQLETILESTVGEIRSRQADGTPLVSGFVSDIGRLPHAGFSLLSGSEDSGDQLHELWDEQSALAESFPFRFRSGPKSPVDLSHIQLPCGWRGPYLHLPIGQTSLVDAWGEPFQLVTDSQMAIESVTWQPKIPFDKPLSCDLKIGIVNISGTLNFDQTEPSTVEVFMLAPDPESSTNQLAVIADEDNNPLTFTFSNATIGLRAIHVKYDGGQRTKYVHVPHDGLSLVINLEDATPAKP